MIKEYKENSNISILNTIYHKPKKMENGKYDNGSIDIVYRDLDSGEKKFQHIVDPSYTYYEANEGVQIQDNEFFIEEKYVHPVKCSYANRDLSIAKLTNNEEYYWDNIRNRNKGANYELYKNPRIFNADLDIEDFYRYEFNRLYKNELYTPDILYFDIEVDTIDAKNGFPELGECPINAVTVLSESKKTSYTLLLENYDNELIEGFKQEPNLPEQIKEFVIEKVGGEAKARKHNLDEFDFKFVFFQSEIELIASVFNLINMIKPDYAVAWNIAFDLPYFIERIKVLGYAPEDIICHPDFTEKEAWYYVDKRADKFEQRGDYARVSSYTVYLDQLISFASIRKGQRKLPVPFKLDAIGDYVAGVRKLDYSHITKKISLLPYKDYKVFAFYNVMDVIVQKCIEDTVGDIGFVHNKAIITNTRFDKVHRQTVYLVNVINKEFHKKGFILGNNINKGNEKVGFPGAFVADPLNISDKPKIMVNGKAVNLFDLLNDFDYKALYPSIIDENNIAPYTMYGKMFFPEQLDPTENKFNNEYFDRSVWFTEDLVCRDRLNFCNRYLNLANYEQMHDDIIEYITTVKQQQINQYRDNITGLYTMATIVNSKPKESLCDIVDKPQTMCFIRGRMSN